MGNWYHNPRAINDLIYIIYAPIWCSSNLDWHRTIFRNTESTKFQWIPDILAELVNWIVGTSYFLSIFLPCCVESIMMLDIVPTFKLFL